MLGCFRQTYSQSSVAIACDSQPNKNCVALRPLVCVQIISRRCRTLFRRVKTGRAFLGAAHFVRPIRIGICGSKRNSAELTSGVLGVRLVSRNWHRGQIFVWLGMRFCILWSNIFV
jgi:hypothetical protein